jgi:hypothetical protein
MSGPPLSLLELKPAERAELASVLWESLTDAERDARLELTPVIGGRRPI